MTSTSQHALNLEPQAVLEWVRLPQQARTRANLVRLLDAAEALLGEKSFDEMTIADVARRSRTSIGGFYRRFRDKDALLHALHERFCEDARATSDDALDPDKWHGASLATILERITEFVVRIYNERQGLLRAFLLRGVTNPSVRERSDRLFTYMGEKMAVLLAERAGEISHPDPASAAAFALRVLLGTLDQTLQLQPSAAELDSPHVTRELTRVLTGYLGVPADAAR